MFRVVACCVVALSTSVRAQEAPPPAPPADAAPAAPAAPTAPPEAPPPAEAAPVPAAPPPAVVPAAPAPAEPPSARTRLLGGWSFGFLGGMPVLRGAPAMNAQGQSVNYATVPVLGVRWWTPWRLLGLEFGVGAMVSGGSATGSPTFGAPSGPADVEVLFHVSAPIAFASTPNTILFVAPEARFGFGITDASGTGGGSSDAYTLNFGVRAGAELFFGLIGLPNLSLEAGVRVGVAHEWRAYYAQTGPSRWQVLTTSQTRFATSLVANPWDLFTSTLAAHYYF